MIPFAALLPYIAVLLGMKLLRSAWAAVLIYHAGILLLLWLRRPAAARRLFRGAGGPLLLPAMLICALAAPIIRYGWPWIEGPALTLPEWLRHYGLEGTAWLLLIPWFAFVHPVLEELHWRTLPAGASLRPNRFDLLFAGYHLLVLHDLLQWFWLPAVFFVLVGASVFWRYAADRFNGLLLPVLTHAAADAAVIGGALMLK